MYKVTIHEKINGEPSLIAFVNEPERDILIDNGVVVFADVDGEYLIVPLKKVGYVSVLKAQSDD